MNEAAPSRSPRSLVLFLGGALVLVALASGASAQNFAVGAGGLVSNDRSAAGSPSNFSYGGAFAFGEVRMEKGVTLQLRAWRFRLPGAEASAPKIRVDAATLSVAYTFKEEWFEAGFFGGGGVYRVVPNDASTGQSSADVRETAWGLTGGVLSDFLIGGPWVLRIEGGINYVASVRSHSPIFLAGAVALRF